MVRLTAALISAIHDGADITSITSLIVPRRDLDQLVGLDVCERLTRLDLSDNRLSTLEGVTLCTSLQWLSVAGNQLTSLKGVESLPKLTVLNASRNQLTSMNEVAVLTELRALILNDNEISTVCRLDRLVNLNTVVLSRNPIRNLGNFASKLLSLKKLSMSHCQVQILGSSLKRCLALEELRLAHNQLSSLPQELERNGRLSILDLGTNHLKAWSDLQPLGTLHSLSNLNLHGNPICAEDVYKDEVVKRLPHLQILDGHPLRDTNKKRKSRNIKSKEADVLGADGYKEKSEKGDFRPHLGKEFKSKSIKKVKQEKGLQGPQVDVADLPFLDLVVSTEQVSRPDAEDAKVVSGKWKKRKDDDCVVSVFEAQRGSRPSHRIDELLTQGLEIGTGGPSTWDVPSAMVAGGMEQAENKPYSRWALKKKK